MQLFKRAYLLYFKVGTLELGKLISCIIPGTTWVELKDFKPLHEF